MENQPINHDQQKLERMLTETLGAASPADEGHYELDELSRLAAARREQGEAWEMPAHLSRCSLCLETFQAILEGVAAVSASALKRFGALGKNGANIVAFPAPWKLALRVAALAALLLVSFGLFSHFNNRSAAHVSGGTVALPNGVILPHGAAIPGGVTVMATDDVSARLTDGSNVELAKDSQVSFRESLAGNTTLALTTGKLTASVAKQKPGKEFAVTTPLGNVVVVGTLFSVSSLAEDVVVYETVAGQTQQRTAVVQAVRVIVFEGVVRVQRQGEQVNVTAPQMAVIRENEPGIEVQ